MRLQGIEHAIYERASELREIGAGIGLQAAGINAMAAIGRGDGLREITSVPVQELRVFAHDGRWLTTWPQFGASIGVHRGELLKVLKEGVEASVINCGCECVGLRQDPDGVTVAFADGREERGAVAVGADGLRSTVRGLMQGDGLRYAGYTEWRSFADLRHPEVPDGIAKNVLGPGGLFGMMPLSNGRTNWFCKMGRSEGAGDPPTGRRQDLLHTFGGWTEPIRAMIEATPEERVDRQDVFDRKPVTTWGRGRITLLGDAAHPTSPSLGQGAGMAIEDGPALARALAAAGGLRDRSRVEAALRRYEQDRIPRTTKITNASNRWNHVVTLRNSIGVAARALLLSRTPERLWRTRVESEVNIDLSPRPAGVPGGG